MQSLQCQINQLFPSLSCVHVCASANVMQLMWFSLLLKKGDRSALVSSRLTHLETRRTHAHTKTDGHFAAMSVPSVLQFPEFSSSTFSSSPHLEFPQKVTYNVSDSSWNHYNNLSLFFHALCPHLHIWMSRLVGLFNHCKLLCGTITKVTFVLAYYS